MSEKNTDPTAGLKGDALMAKLREEHWFWGTDEALNRLDDESQVEVNELGVPVGMVAPGDIFNPKEMLITSFLEELEQDGIELSKNPANPEQLVIDRVEFMEWLIVRYLPYSLVSRRGEEETSAAEQVDVAKLDGEAEDEDERYEHQQALERAEVESQKARSGWVRLERIADHTGVAEEELFHIFAERYAVGLVPGSTDQWITKWFDAFDWLREHFAEKWDPSAEQVSDEIASLVEKGISEAAAVEKVRRAYINENAALPISKTVGIHTNGDVGELHEGYQVIGFDAAGEVVSNGGEYRWEPYSAKEAQWGFPIWGEGREY